MGTLTKETQDILRETMQNKYAKASLSGYCYYLVIENQDGTQELVERMGNPCFGELRIYLPNGYRPSDLFWPFPEKGTPVGLGVFWPKVSSFTTDKWLMENFLEPDYNIFRDGTPEYEVVYTKDGSRAIGYILSESRVYSDIMYQSLRSHRYLGTDQKRLKDLIDMGFTPAEARVLFLLSNGSTFCPKTILTGKDLRIHYHCKPKIEKEHIFYRRETFREDEEKLDRMLRGAPEEQAKHLSKFRETSLEDFQKNMAADFFAYFAKEFKPYSDIVLEEVKKHPKDG